MTVTPRKVFQILIFRIYSVRLFRKSIKVSDCEETEEVTLTSKSAKISQIDSDADILYMIF